MKIPEPAHSIQALIDQYHEQHSEPPRGHLGCSSLGHHCDRWLWLSFRWAVLPSFPGRVLRLFRRGQNEEHTVVSDLRAIGLDVRNVSSAQSRVNFDCHVSGSLDGIIKSGVPGSPNKPHVLEIKTHSLKSFNELDKLGVAKAKPEHFIQMQCYMHGTEIDRALYVSVCKDDDRIYTERVRYDKEIAEAAIARGHRLALAERMPPPISDDPSWYLCKFCAAHEFCHGTKTTKHANCRTCTHVTPKDDSSWRCERHEADNIPIEFQRQGCESHVIHPDLVPWKIDEELSSETVAAWIIDGKRIRNGEASADTFTSKEILSNLELILANDPFVLEVREAFNARIDK